MAIFQCKECGGKVSDRATECPHCGYPIVPATGVESEPETDNQLLKSKTWLWVSLAVAACAIGIGSYFCLRDDKAETTRTVTVSDVEPEEAEATVVLTTPDLEFNELHGEVSKVEWIKSDEVWTIIGFTYDEEGNMYPVQSNDHPANSYYRNNNGQIIQEDVYQENSIFYTWKNGKVHSQIPDYYKSQFDNEPDADKYYRFYSYNDDGTLKEITCGVYNGDDAGLVSNYTKTFSNYKFDDMGNWTSREATASYDIHDWYDNSDKHQTSKSKEYRVIKYRNHESAPVKSIKDVQHEWKSEQGIQ